jgi:hypothetical protein
MQRDPSPCVSPNEETPKTSKYMSTTQISRKQLLKALLALGGGGAALSLLQSGCGDSSSTPGPDTLTDAGVLDSGQPDSGTPDSGNPDSGAPDSGMPDSGTPDSGVPDGGVPDGGTDGGLAYCLNGAQNGVITGNHGHSLYVPRPDIELGQETVYNIQGTSSHPHYVTLTADHFARLAQNQTFVVTSTNNAGHTHDVTVQCAP